MVRIAVLGIGNVLTGDDAVGPYAVRLLEAGYEIPEGLALIDAGTPGLDLTAFMAGLEALVIVDAVRAKGRPGELRRYDKAALLEKAPLLALSPHEPGVREALLHTEFMGASPREVKLVGVVPKSVVTRVGLSDAVRSALPAVVGEVLKELARLGIQLRERSPRRTPDIWWER